MLENTLPQLEQLIEQVIEKNNQLKNQVTELEQQKLTLTHEKSALVDENEMLQLEALEGEEKQKQTSDVLTSLLGKLQSVQEVN